MTSPRAEQRCYRNAGQLYTGDVLESEDGLRLRHGLGRQIVHAQTVRGESVVWGRYTGAFKQDKMTGSGTYRWSDGSVYEGDLQDGRPHGHGKFTWPEGSSYDGLWQEGEMMGQGTFYNFFTGHTRQGAFYRNSLRLHDGTWLDLSREREEQRAALLRIGSAGPSAEAKMPVFRCRPEEAVAKVIAVLREPPHLVPLVMADASCPVQPDGVTQPRPRSVAPLWCLQTGDLGCTDNTTVHMAFAAAEMRRKRDVQQIFRNAICEALSTYRPFVLAFGEESEGGNPQDDEAPAPACWRLSEFFDDVSLPLDLFDLRHFQGSGGFERFLPREKRGWRCAPEETPAPADAAEAATGASGEAAPQDSEGAGKPPQKLSAAKAFLLHFALASLRRLDRHLDDAAVRSHVGRRFSEHVPLHRVAAVVVSTD